MSIGSKNSQNLERAELKRVLAVARGETRPDLLVKNIRILDLVNGGEKDSCLAICGKTIAGVGLEYLEAGGTRVVDGKGAVVVPGFIDGHLHIESSLTQPFEFERLTLPLGTTTAICDPHEITNVLGAKGFNWFLRCSEEMTQNLFVQASSCIPSLPGFETNGGDFPLEQMKKIKQHKNVLGLAEMMNFPGVINGDDEVLDKLEAFEDLNVDGHCPMVRGKELNAYIAAGIQNCHETVGAEEGREKLEKGMALIIREGSVAKNLDTLAPLVSEFNSPQCFLCTDDRNPFEIHHEGHINFMVKKLINDNGLAPHVAYRLSSFSAAKHFGLKRLGLIAPGKQADFILLNDVEQVGIDAVYIKGKEVGSLELEKNMAEKFQLSHPPLENSILREVVKTSEFNFDLTDGTYNVIGIIPEEIITNHLKIEYANGAFVEEDVLKIAVFERYGKNQAPALGLVKGLGLREGAIASSVAHDSHNLIVIGTNEDDMALALNTLIESGGGFSITCKKEVRALLPLPIAGIMTAEPGEKITENITILKREFKRLGVVLEEPFLQMAFLALPVIPNLKITDKGLVDVSQFKFTELRV
ncbi:MAG: adenine deaminase [Halobacteriovoraceae bacterium]|jgi:adenine deaminase|nr:adenine deaminase [Halobacteriovoraceae bacterium]